MTEKEEKAYMEMLLEQQQKQLETLKKILTVLEKIAHLNSIQ